MIIISSPMRSFISYFVIDKVTLQSKSSNNFIITIIIMKLSFSAFFLVLAGCSKTAANAANNTATAAIVELAVASTKVKKTKDKTNDKDPSANVVVAAAAFEATITTSNFVPPTCSPDEILIEVDLYTDYTPQENWWTVTKNIKYRGEEYTSMTPVLTGGPYLDDDSQDVTLIQDAVCVPKEEQYSVTIYVSVIIMYIYAAVSIVLFIILYMMPHAALRRHASFCPNTSHIFETN